MPTWRTDFLLNSARYFAGQARQLERDALQFQASAEQEQASQRLLVDRSRRRESQLAVEGRRGEEAAAAVAVADEAAALAQVRQANGEESIREWQRRPLPARVPGDDRRRDDHGLQRSRPSASASPASGSSAGR